MTREELKKGTVIRKGKAEDNEREIAFHYVSLDDKTVGVGLYHDKSRDCTIAMVKDFKGNPLGQEESAGYPTTAQELEELETYFHKFLAT